MARAHSTLEVPKPRKGENGSAVLRTDCSGAHLCSCFADGFRMCVRVVERAMGERTETVEVQHVWERVVETVNAVDRRRGDDLMKLYRENALEPPLF